MIRACRSLFDLLAHATQLLYNCLNPPRLPGRFGLTRNGGASRCEHRRGWSEAPVAVCSPCPVRGLGIAAFASCSYGDNGSAPSFGVRDVTPLLQDH